jgi:hypothetical protein
LKLALLLRETGQHFGITSSYVDVDNLTSLVAEGQEWTGYVGRQSVFHSRCIDRQAARGDALVAVETGIGRSGINHSEIVLELDERIIPGLN